MALTAIELSGLVEVAGGRREADLYIEGGNLLNVYSGEIYPANLAVLNGWVAYVGTSRAMVGKSTQILKAEGYFLSPAYLECHFHPGLYSPISLAEGVMPLGATALVCDNLFFFLYAGEKGFSSLVEWMDRSPFGFYWTARLTSQSPFPGELSLFDPAAVERLFSLPRVLNVAEITRWPALAGGDPALLSLVAKARAKGLRIDGHTAGSSYERLNCMAPSLDSCHEAITAQEAAERLRLGLWVMLRHSSLRQDLPELLRAITEMGLDSGRIMITTDSSTPGYIANFGFLDGMLRLAVEAGMDPVRALRMATLNPATYLGMDTERGGLAPGRRADLLFLPDLKSFRPDLVLMGGQVVAEKGELLQRLPSPPWEEFGMKSFLPPPEDLADPDLYGYPALEPMEFPVIDLVSAVITRVIRRTLHPRGGFLERDPDLLYCALLDRGGQWRSLGLVKGLGRLEAVAATYNASLNLLVAGENRRAMAEAAMRAARMGGGIVLLREGRPVFELPLEICGIMSSRTFQEGVRATRLLDEEADRDGYPHNDFLYSLLFLVTDFLPSLRLTPLGLMDVKAGKVLLPALPWKTEKL